MSWYLMGLENGTEYMETISAGCLERKAGAWIIAFSDVDWAALEEKCESLRDTYEETRNLSMEFALWYQQLCREMEPLHPLMGEFVHHQLMGDLKNILMEQLPPDTERPEWQYVMALEKDEPVQPIPAELPRLFLRQFSTRFHTFFDIQAKLIPMMDAVLDAGGEYAELSVLQRYCLMRQESKDYMVLAETLYPTLKTEFRVAFDGRFKDFWTSKPVTPEDVDKIKRKKLIARTYQATDHLEALALWEFDYLAANNITLHRCGHCGCYFIPYSVTSCYCDRPAEDRPGKTCKDIGAASKHQRDVNQDATKALYKKVNNRVQTWAGRHEAQYPNARKSNYKNWQYDAQRLMEKVEVGEMDYDGFAEALDRPPKELLGL
jgi:hypothetical protein